MNPIRFAFNALLDLRNGWLAARRQRALCAAFWADEAKLKDVRATVLKVGQLVPHYAPDGVTITSVTIFNWQFQPNPECPAQRVDAQGEMRVFGYSAKELLEIHARKSEFTQ